jgi:hypothetical protein
MWMGAEGFAEVRRTHDSLKLRPTPPSDLRLPEGFDSAGIGNAREGVNRRQAIQGAASRCTPAGTTRGPSSELAHAGAQAAGHGRHEDTYSRRTAGAQDRQPRVPCDPQIARRDRREEWPDVAGHLNPTSLIPYHWHTTNILWIRGRLPWIIPGRHA